MKSSPVVKRSIVINGHKTSVSLEEAFWSGLKQIAAARALTLSKMVTLIDADRTSGSLSSAIRLFVLDQYRNMVDAAEGLKATQVAARVGPLGANAA